LKENHGGIIIPRRKVKNMPRKQQQAAMANINRKHNYKPIIREPRTPIWTPKIPSDKTDIPQRIKRIITDNPEKAKALLMEVAVWSGCTLAPEACPLIRAIYQFYKGRNLVLELSIDKLNYDYDLSNNN
jgi:hypothetical protein